MTTRRAAMHSHRHASPARSTYSTLRERIERHELCIGDLRKRYVESTRAIQQQNAVDAPHGNEVAVPQQSDGTSATSDRCAGTGEPEACAPVQSDNGRNEVTPAPQAGGATGSRTPKRLYEKRVKAALTQKRYEEWKRLTQLGYGFDWKVPEVEALHGAESKAVEIFKRYRQCYDEQFKPIPGKFR